MFNGYRDALVQLTWNIIAIPLTNDMMQPMKYVHGFIVPCFIVIIYQGLADSGDTRIGIWNGIK